MPLMLFQIHIWNKCIIIKMQNDWKQNTKYYMSHTLGNTALSLLNVVKDVYKVQKV